MRAVNDFLFQRGATISDAAQHRDPIIDRFFMRGEFEEAEAELPGAETLDRDLKAIASKFNMQWHFFDLAVKPKVLIAVSKR